MDMMGVRVVVSSVIRVFFICQCAQPPGSFAIQIALGEAHDDSLPGAIYSAIRIILEWNCNVAFALPTTFSFFTEEALECAGPHYTTCLVVPRKHVAHISNGALAILAYPHVTRHMRALDGILTLHSHELVVWKGRVVQRPGGHIGAITRRRCARRPDPR